MSDEAREGLRAALRWAGAALVDEMALVTGPTGPPGPPGPLDPTHEPRITQLEEDVMTLRAAVAALQQTGPTTGPGPGPEPVIITPAAEDAYYISTTGNDDNPGTITAPWRTLQKAASVMIAGNTVYLRGGTYNSLTHDVYQGTINFANGTALNPITIASYPGERATFDGFEHPYHPRTFGDGRSSVSPRLLELDGDFIVWENLTFQGGIARGISHRGNDCTFRGLIVRKNNGDGFFPRVDAAGTWGRRHLVEDCDFYDNYSIENGGNSASGLKMPSSTDVIVRNCRSWNNSDDGFDFYKATGHLVEDCVAFNNGYGPSGNGMGFKMSGGTNAGGAIIRNCVGTRNLKDDFDSNYGWNITFENNTSWWAGRDGFAFSMYTRTDAGPINTGRNNIAFASGRDAFRTTVTFQNNTWNLGISDPLFLSTSPASADFLALASGSPCRGAGVAGVDLGAIPFGDSFPLSIAGLWSATAGGVDRVYS